MDSTAAEEDELAARVVAMEAARAARVARRWEARAAAREAVGAGTRRWR